jgi:hypothetical protein
LEISRASLASSSAESAVDSFAPLRRPAKAISAIAPTDQQDQRREPQQRRVPLKARAQQHELAVAGDQEIDNFLIAVAKANALAHQHPQVARERCLGIID